MVPEPVEGVFRLMSALYTSAPVPGHQEVEVYPGLVQPTLQRFHPTSQCAPRLEIASNGEPNAASGIPVFLGPRQRHAHVDDLEGQAANVPVGLKYPGQKVRELLFPIADKGVGQPDRPDLALAQVFE